MLSVVVLAHDETDSLEKCLKSVSFADDILIVIDSLNRGQKSLFTNPKARSLNHPLNGNFSAQRNYALSQVKSEWVLFVDADEVVTPELAKNITLKLQKPATVNGYLIHRIDCLWQRQLKYGDLSELYLLRLARKNSGQWHGLVHETWQVKGQVEKISGDLVHTPHPSLNDFLHSINFYSSIRARELYENKFSASVFSIIFFPLGKFLYLWLIKKGVLDGVPGLVHAITMSFYSFMVKGKLYLLNKRITN